MQVWPAAFPGRDAAGLRRFDERMVKVQVKSNEPLDKALRRLRKICNNEGITREMKRNSFYEKPSERRRRKARERIKAIRIGSRQ